MPDDGRERLMQAVHDAYAATPDPRLRELMTALTRHLLDFAREVDLRPDEWLAGLRFLTATGQASTDRRPEFVLLSDTLGLSSMVVALAQARAGGQAEAAAAATEATIEGPFHWPGAPERPLGSDIAAGARGEPTLYLGRVTDTTGRPIAGALLDVWSSDGEGRYDVQLSNPPTMQARARLRCDDEGHYRYWSVRPSRYPIPDDGPVGEMLRATGRGIHRPGHLHLMVSAPGFVPLTTQIFDAGSLHLDDDAVFGTRACLVVDFVPHPPGRAEDGHEMEVPYCSARFDIRLARAGR